MTRPVRVSFACCIAALSAAAPAGASRDVAPHLEYSVGYASPAALRAAVAKEHAAVVQRIPALRVARVRLAGSAGRLAAAPGIRFVDRLAARADTSEPGVQLASERTETFEWQYAAAREDSVPDWVLRAASSVTIAVIDTGGDVTAPDIAAKAPLTHNVRTRTSDVRDTFGHGTFVAALAAGSVTNGEGISGFGGDARLLIVKAGSDGSFTDVDEAAAITYAVEHGARIVNLSFGGPTTTTTEKSAMRYAAAHGVLVVAAAGNEYLGGNPVFYPAALLQPLGSRGVAGIGLSVGASTASGDRAAFSNTGTYVSVAAPGEEVFSAVSSASSPSSFPRVPLPGSVGGLYGYGSGTSFAAPQVAGAAALVMAANPLLRASTVAEILKSTASGRGAWSPELGYGVIDVASAVERATATDATGAQTSLRLKARALKRRVRLTATLSSLPAGTSTAGRSVAFDLFRTSGRTWRTLGTARTRADGTAVWNLTLRKAGPTKLRARWAGAGDLAPASSGVVTTPLR